MVDPTILSALDEIPVSGGHSQLPQIQDGGTGLELQTVSHTVKPSSIEIFQKWVTSPEVRVCGNATQILEQIANGIFTISADPTVPSTHLDASHPLLLTAPPEPLSVATPLLGDSCPATLLTVPANVTAPVVFDPCLVCTDPLLDVGTPPSSHNNLTQCGLGDKPVRQPDLTPRPDLHKDPEPPKTMGVVP